MIYLGIDKQTATLTKAQVVLQHFYPELLPQDVIDAGFVVNKLPDEPLQKSGNVSTLFINPQTKELWYEYTERPLTKDEEIQQLKDQQDLMQSALDDLILGGAL